MSVDKMTVGIIIAAKWLKQDVCRQNDSKHNHCIYDKMSVDKMTIDIIIVAKWLWQDVCRQNDSRHNHCMYDKMSVDKMTYRKRYFNKKLKT